MYFNKIRHVAVIGAGTMGSQIAGWLARWFDVDLFDVQQDDVHLAKRAWSTLLERDFVLSQQDLFHIHPCTIGVDDQRLERADWIVEAVFEDLAVKQEVFQRIDEYRNPNAIVCSNTSGLDIDEIVAGRSKELREHAFVAHFFNPVAVLPLLEVCAGKDTDPQLVKTFLDFGRETLQKGVVEVFNTPNFVGNRLGVMAMQIPFFHWTANLSVADVDAVFQVLFGCKPLNTADIVGLQLLEPVAGNVFMRVSPDEDPFHRYFRLVERVQQLVRLGNTGRNSPNKRGFYAREGKTKMMFDFDFMTYVEEGTGQHPFLLNALRLVQEGKSLEAARLLLEGGDEAAVFARNCFYPILMYALWLVGKVCKDPATIDKVMRWGFNWPLGPLQVCDLFGHEAVIVGAESAGCREMLPSWYLEFKGVPIYDVPLKPTCTRQLDGTDENIPERGEMIDFSVLRRENYKYAISRNNDATAYYTPSETDMVLVEFHSGSVNPFRLSVAWVIEEALDMAEADSLPVVIGNTHPKAFCAGADLKWLLVKARERAFGEIEKFLVRAQDLTQRMTYASVPVVVAPHQLALGLGSELILASHMTVANLWLFQAQPEFNAGLVAAAGGCMRTLRNALEGVPFHVMASKAWTAEVAKAFLKPVLLLHVQCTRSKHAEHARELGFLRPGDLIVHPRGLGQEHVLWHACMEAERLQESRVYAPRRPFLFNLPGSELAEPLAEEVMRELQFPTDSHQALIVNYLAHLLCGGNTKLGQLVTEQDLLDLERGTFLSLVGMQETQSLIAKIVEKA